MNRKWFVAVMAYLWMGAACIVSAQVQNPEVKMAIGPLYSGRGNVHPNVLLSLSVEFPTVGVAYRGDNGTYNRDYEYVGYFNPTKCYSYHGGNRNVSDDAYFEIAGDANATTHECDGKTFSGNFMNWIASSAIDMLRYALTGGDRVIDKPGLTVLQRAVIRAGESSNFYAHSTYFPRRVVTGGGNVSAPGKVTPFNVTTLHVVSCRNRILFSNTSSGLAGNNSEDSKKADSYCTSKYDGTGNPPTEAIDKKLGEYLVRVKVCDASEGPVRTDLCQKYGDGYKPVGEIQRRASKLRLAAMGYLLDDSPKRYGGVLRAPMKYVGPKKVEAPDFFEKSNDKLEWDPETGVLYSNPEDTANPNSTTANSGVINYLNKFGRSGIYKGYDPVSELYYEGIRYLQGKTPTLDATAGMTEAMKDGFPVYESWTDPVTASCQNNYILTIADVNTHWDRYIPGNDRTTYGNGTDAYDNKRAVEPEVAGKTPELDVRIWSKKVGEMESDTTGTYTNPAKNSTLTDLDKKDTGAGGHGTYYMAGLAYWANVNDIRKDKPIRVKTFAIDVDEGGNGLIDGNNRAIKPRNSQLYLAAKYGGFNDVNGDGNPFTTLSIDGTTQVTSNTAEWSNDGSVPSNYFLAGQPRELIKAIQKAFAAMGAASGSISGVSLSNSRITTDGVFVYQPSFDSSKWSGSLKKLALSLTNNATVQIAKNPQWDAGAILTGTSDNQEVPPNPLPADRSIYTAKPDAGKTLATIEFKWDKLSDTQKAALNISPETGQNDGLGEKRLAYLRGERSDELGKPGGIFRVRDRVLGDIINSNPVYVGAPSLRVQGEGYQQFYEKNKNRTQTIYIGANDGMLHAFNADNGKEIFAYVPNALMQGLPELTRSEYQHRPYVDGGISVSEARVGEQWKTVLVSGMGGGAQGVFALDVTQPSAFEGGLGAIFEFTDADDPDMGNLTGLPVIAKFRTGLKDGVVEYKYFVVVSSGWNNYRNDGNGKFNSDAAGALFLLSLDKPTSQPWKLGTNYFKFRTPSKDSTLSNGLAAPSLALGANGAVRFIYAGDLQGNLWRFNFTGNAPWEGALASDTPLFVARDQNGVRQPITTQPRVVFAPGGGFVVLFGTGKFLEDADAASGSFKRQSFYGIYDTTAVQYSVSGRAELAARSVSTASGNAISIAGDVFTYGSGNNEKRGWYFDFIHSENTGERSVTNVVVVDGVLYFNSLIPSGDPCAAGGGRSYMLNTLSGLVPDGKITGQLSQVGMLSSPVPLETAVDIGDRNSIGRRVVKKTHAVFNFGTGGSKGAAAQAENGSQESILPAGRFSWREILNWLELKQSFSKNKGG